MTTIAQIADVRSIGSLLSVAEGGANDSQLTAALTEASWHTRMLVTKEQYLLAASYDEHSSEEEQAMKEAFKNAEARFALSFLPIVLTNVQLQQTGYKLESSVGRATTKFGNADEISIITDFWVSEAMTFISPFFADAYYDAERNEDFGWDSDDGDIGLMSI